MHLALIDDDEAVLDSLQLYLQREGLTVACFQSADAFLARADAEPPFDCIVADVKMPGLSGIDLVRNLAAQRHAPPVILITGHGDVDMAVAAIKLGAFDFLEKPFEESRLLAEIRRAVDEYRHRQRAASELADLRARYDGLSDRQRQVLERAVSGLSNKEIAARLGISFRTVEIHRAWMMERMGARNLAELVRMQMQMRDADAEGANGR
jgi:two-component system response regulator FixJ